MIWVIPSASRTEAGMGWCGGAGRGACREHYEKGFFIRPSLGAAMGEDGGREMCYLIFSTHARGLWA